MGDFYFFLFEMEALGGLGLADLVVEILIDEGSACFAEGASEFGWAELEEEDEDN